MVASQQQSRSRWPPPTSPPISAEVSHTRLELTIEIRRGRGDKSLGLEIELCAGRPTIAALVDEGAAVRSGLRDSVRPGDIVIAVEPEAEVCGGVALIDQIARSTADPLRLRLLRDPAHSRRYTTMALADSWLEYLGEGDRWCRGFFMFTVGAGLEVHAPGASLIALLWLVFLLIWLARPHALGSC